MPTFWTLEIWDALRAAAAESDLSQAQVIVDCAGVIVQNTDLTICYDERGKQTLLHQISITIRARKYCLFLA